MMVRAMRPDRVTSALRQYVNDYMGERFIEQAPFDIFETWPETAYTTPIFFVLFPGTDPTKDVEAIGAQHDITIANGKLFNISMGQGQEEKAINELQKAAENGTWVMFQNVHLMQTWLKTFEKKLDEVILTANENFRCIVSSEPPPIATQQIVPESILQKCVKISNESPSDLKANMRRAYSKFSQEMCDASSKPNEYKSILFALCYFHSAILGR